MTVLDRSSPDLNIVLLSDSPSWAETVSDQARALGLQPIRATKSAREALVMLAGGSPAVSHLLLQPDSAGHLLAELIDMTSGQNCGPALVVLGEPDRLPRHPYATAMTFVQSPSQGWLQRVLAPAQGRDRVVSKALNERDLKEALLNSRIQTRYQPIVRLDNRKPAGLEVLARLEHPQRGILQPDLFMPQIEATGLSWPLTAAVISRAFDDWGGGRLGSFGLTLAFNFPLDVLLIPEALTWLEARRRMAGLPADRLVIELTESRPISELHRLRHAISTLRGIGYGLAIDDVGPEVRDHKALLDLQFTVLKLDKDLVRKSLHVPQSNMFLTNTIASARAANLTIVAEGVEDTDIWQQMQSLGVDHAQGFLVARPLPAAAVPLWHDEWCARPMTGPGAKAV